jgi:hypothetical protein
VIDHVGLDVADLATAMGFDERTLGCRPLVDDKEPLVSSGHPLERLLLVAGIDGEAVVLRANALVFRNRHPNLLPAGYVVRIASALAEKFEHGFLAAKARVSSSLVDLLDSLVDLADKRFVPSSLFETWIHRALGFPAASQSSCPAYKPSLDHACAPLHFSQEEDERERDQGGRPHHRQRHAGCAHEPSQPPSRQSVGGHGCEKKSGKRDDEEDQQEEVNAELHMPFPCRRQIEPATEAADIAVLAAGTLGFRAE